VLDCFADILIPNGVQACGCSEREPVDNEGLSACVDDAVFRRSGEAERGDGEFWEGKEDVVCDGARHHDGLVGRGVCVCSPAGAGCMCDLLEDAGRVTWEGGLFLRGRGGGG
jgi:hypothetical protein